MKSYEIGSRPAARKRRLISTTSFDQHCTKRYIQHDRSQASKAHICTSLGKKNGRELPDLQETCGQLHAWYDTEPAQHTPSFVTLNQSRTGRSSKPSDSSSASAGALRCSQEWFVLAFTVREVIVTKTLTNDF